MPRTPRNEIEFARMTVAEIRRRLVDDRAGLSKEQLQELADDPRQGVRALRKGIDLRRRRAEAGKRRLQSLLRFQSDLHRAGVERVAGVDEAGVGPLAGPVVAAAVIFPPEVGIVGVDDSKRLDEERRGFLAQEIRSRARGIGIGLGEVHEIDRLNIYQATLLAMRRAVLALPEAPQHLLVDARTVPGLEIPQTPFIKGDSRHFAIAAASIIAKTHRDGLMRDLAERLPGYGFDAHKGYPTEEHREAIRRLGPCSAHRRSFTLLPEQRDGQVELF